MDTLQNMRAFVKVVEAGSFTAAAQRMNTTTAYASRAVSDLEAHLRARLLNRTTRRIALTEAGERYLQRCEEILAYVDQAEAEAENAQALPSGKLKVHAMPSLGQHYLVPAIAGYQARYPTVSVSLALSQRLPDLLEEGFDVSITLSSALHDSGLVSQRLGSMYSILCASPGYAGAHGLPGSTAALAEHPALQLVTPMFATGEWRLHGPRGEETIDVGAAKFQVNAAEALAVAIRAGMGIGPLPLSSAAPALRDGTLVRVLPGYRLHLLNLYALYASRQYLDAKIKTWIRFLREELPAALAADEAALGGDPTG
jgi:DNA-binding transcriptional LysR family regulator